MKKKRILITGAKGFIGTHLVPALEAKGFTVVPWTKADGDIVQDKLNAENIDHVVHLAAKTFVPESWEKPESFYETNTLGTLRVLEFCRKNNCSLTFNSTYVYGAQKKLPIPEDASINATAPYHHSKILAEELCRFYAGKFNLNITILRPFNIYGRNQKELFLIPKLVRQITDNTVKTIDVFDLTPRRDYLYIDDFVEALISTLDVKGLAIYNVGSGESISVKDLITLIAEVAGKKKELVSHDVKRPSEIPDAVADITKITREIGWHPKISLREGIKQVISSYEKN